MKNLDAALARAVVEELGAEVAILDPAGCIRFVNGEWRAFCRRNGGNPDAYIGADYGALLEAEDSPNAEADQAILAVLKGHQDRSRVNYICDAPGVRRHFVMSAVAVHAGGERLTVLAHTLVSEHEIGDRLDHTNEDPGLGDLRQRLVDLVSHQFRTPLTPMRMDIATLLAKASDDMRPVAERLARNIKRMDTLVSAGVDMERLESQASVNLQPRPALDALRAALEYGVQKEARNTPIDVVLRGDDCVMALDLAWLGRAARELISNAVRHGAAPVRVEIEHHGETVSVIVHDAGGDGAMDANNVFAPLTQGHDDIGLGEGLGLGLSIVRRVAEIHGGTARYQADDQGTVVAMDLPVRPGTELEAPAVSAEARPPRP